MRSDTLDLTSPCPSPGRSWLAPLRTVWHVLLCAAGAREQLDTASDDALVDLVREDGPQRGDAYRALVLRYQSWLLRLVTYLMGGRAADAEDVTQEVFVRAFLALDSYRGDASFGAWLRVIAMRTAFNYKRAKNTLNKYEDRAYTEDVIFSSPVLPGERALMAREEVELALEALSWPYREILVLRYVEEMELEEISEALGIGLSAAKMRLKRARDAFRAQAGGTQES